MGELTCLNMIYPQALHFLPVEEHPRALSRAPPLARALVPSSRRRNLAAAAYLSAIAVVCRLGGLHSSGIDSGGTNRIQASP